MLVMFDMVPSALLSRKYHSSLRNRQMTNNVPSWQQFEITVQGTYG